MVKLWNKGMLPIFDPTHWPDLGTGFVRPEKFQFLEKGQNRNFDYKIVISVKNPKFFL